MQALGYNLGSVLHLEPEAFAIYMPMPLPSSVSLRVGAKGESRGWSEWGKKDWHLA